MVISMKKPELLAPAGSMESFYAAINAGCDAVYMAGYSFGARAFASNFSNEEIIKCINYAHLYGVKVYITVNTIVYEDEVEMFMNYIDFLHMNNVDAVIMQDLGMIDLVRKTYPNLEIHSSTQMHIYNPAGVKFLEDLGIKRVVLAREADIKMIKKIKENSKAEIEVFVHGALCMSYSGQCLMSSLIGGRSGNRGKCAGTCRQMYDLVDKNNKKYNNEKYLLSTRDLNTLERIGELIDMGIDSLKIEGRMKRPEYVYIVVKIYRKAIDNYLKYKNTKLTSDDILELTKIYNRKFTEGYLFNSKDIMNTYRPNHLGINIGKVIKKEKNKIYIRLSDVLVKGDGIRFLNKKDDTGLTIVKMFLNGKEVIEAHKNNIISIILLEECDIGANVIKTTDIKQLNEINYEINNIKRKVKIDASIDIKAKYPIKIKLTDGVNNIYYESSYIVDGAIKRNTTKIEVEKQFKKTNDTIYEFNKLEIDIDDGSFIPVSKLNEVRRKILNLMDEKRLYSTNYKKEKYEIVVPAFDRDFGINIFVRNEKLYKRISSKNIKNIYMKENLYNEINDERKIIRLDRVNNTIKKYNKALVSDISSIFNGCYTDFSFNVVNSYAVAFLHAIGVNRVTLSHELTDTQINNLITRYKNRYHENPNLELIVYGREEMMISKYNILNNLNKNNNYYLKDKYNNLMPVINENNITTIYNYKIKNLENITDYHKMGINYFRYEYLNEKEMIGENL